MFVSVVRLMLVGIAVCCAPALAGGPAAQAPDPGDQGIAMEHVKAELAFDRTAMSPGGTATVGIRFVIEDGWHLYWRNSGDSGMPISVTFDAPKGVRIGALQWPAPKRHVYGVGSVDYIYEHEVALLADVEIDDRFATGDEIEITASFELLACKEACVFGAGARSSVIGIAESGSMSVPDWMKKNRERIPLRDQSSLRVRWDGTDLLISVYEREGAQRLSFFPSAPAAVRPSKPEIDGISETGLLRIAYSQQIIGAPLVAGVVEVVGPDGPSWIEIETTPPTADADEGGANEPTPHTPTTKQTINNRSGD